MPTQEPVWAASYGPGVPLHLDAVAALPDAADWRLLPPALAQLAPKPLYGRAPDAKLPTRS